MAGILEGLKVVSVELQEAIPAATAWMADWGADVIKVEPLTGELHRGATRVTGVTTAIQLGGVEVSWIFQGLNRNKRGLAVDLKKEPGRDILCQLVQKADVFLSNYQVSSLKKLKLDYATLSQLNPKLIYGVLSGYGSAGPDKDTAGFDRVAMWARAGFQYMLSESGTVPPSQRPGMMDRTAAPHVVAGILGALLHREKTGEGQELEFSLFHSAVWTLGKDIEGALVGRPMPKYNRIKMHNPLWNLYRTKDDRWLSLGMFMSDPFWPEFCRAIERPELENDPRFNNMETRAQNNGELIRILDEVFASKAIEEWDGHFRKYNLIYAPVQSPVEVTTDPQALANDFFVDLNHPAGQFKVVATPVKFTQNPASVRTPAPEVGQHTEEILLDLGYSWEDIAQLKDQGVIL